MGPTLWRPIKMRRHVSNYEKGEITCTRSSLILPSKIWNIKNSFRGACVLKHRHINSFLQPTTSHRPYLKEEILIFYTALVKWV